MTPSDLPALHVRSSSAFRRERGHAVRRVIPRRRDPQPVHDLQPRRKARRALRDRRPARRSAGRDGALRAHCNRRLHRRAAPSPQEWDKAKDQSYFLYATPRSCGSSGSSFHSAKRRKARFEPKRFAGGCRAQGRGEPGALFRRVRRGEPTHASSRPTPPRSGYDPDRSWMRKGGSSASTEGSIGFTVGQREGGGRRPRSTGVRVTDRPRDRDGAPRDRGGVTRLERDGPGGSLVLADGAGASAPRNGSRSLPSRWRMG